MFVGTPEEPKTLLRAEIDPLLFTPCVYHLMLDGEVVYVGQAGSGFCCRYYNHSGSTKEFDGVRIYPASKDHLDFLEAAMILRLNPRYNREMLRPQSLAGLLRKVGVLPPRGGAAIGLKEMQRLAAEFVVSFFTRTTSTESPA